MFTVSGRPALHGAIRKSTRALLSNLSHSHSSRLSFIVAQVQTPCLTNERQTQRVMLRLLLSALSLLPCSPQMFIILDRASAHSSKQKEEKWNCPNPF